MSTILSLPGLSLLFNNYSASSLNLLFFYLTWSTLVLSHPPLRVEILTSIAVRLVFYIIPGLLFCLFDAIAPSLADKPQRYGLRSSGRKKASKGGGGFISVLFMSLLNTLVGAGIQTAVSLIVTEALKSPERALKITTSLPLPWETAFGLIQAIILREIMIYYPHKRIHAGLPPYPGFPRKISHSDPLKYSCLGHGGVGVGEYVVLQFLPTYLPAVMLRMHVLSFLLFEVVVCVSEMLAYSGYDALPGFFLLRRVGRRVRAHGEGGGKGGFGWLGWLDWVHGTDVGGEDGGGGARRGGRRGKSR